MQRRRFPLVYDAEAIFSQRAQELTLLTGREEGPRNALEPDGLEEELALAKVADAVSVVSEADQQTMLQAGIRSVHIVGHTISVLPTSSPFTKRDTFLFIGSMHGLDNPNADSVRDFYFTQWTEVHRQTGALLVVAGYGTELLRTEIDDPTVRIVGARDDLRPLYESARVFVVPTRYAAGLPFKAHEAAGYGVPMVVSPVIGRQMKWRHGVDYFAATTLEQMAEYGVRLYADEGLWEQFRANTLARVKAELSPAVFAGSLQSVLDEVTSARQVGARP